MKIAVVGLGYVGLSNAVLLAQHNTVVALDVDAPRVAAVNRRECPIEDAEMLQFLAQKPLDLQATTDAAQAYRGARFVVVAGTAQLRLDYTTRLLPEGQAAYAPAGTVHQLANPGKLPLTLIELRTGANLAQEDILRYDTVPIPKGRP